MTAPITPAEVVDLLAIIARFDRRTVGAEDNIAWGSVALASGWTHAAARRAIIDHYAATSRWIMPADINAVLQRVRKEARAQFTEDVCPPRELRDDPRAEIEWRRRRVADYLDLALQAWAEGRPLPVLDQRDELGERERPALPAAVASLAARRALPAAERPRMPRMLRRRARNAAALERARQELVNRGPAPLPDPDGAA